MRRRGKKYKNEKIMRTLLDKLISTPSENEVLEFKAARIQYSKDKLGKYFSALGNEANIKDKECAYMVFGVNQDHQIVGTSISDTQLNDFKKEVSDHTSPKMNFIDVHRIKTESGDAIIFVIPPAPLGTPISWKGHRYGRDGESLGGLNDMELALITNQQIDDWSIKIVPDAGLEDLAKEAIIKARKEYANRHPQLMEEMRDWDDMTFLNKSKTAIKGNLTRAAILLLGKEESEHFISPATSKISWILKNKDKHTKDYQHFTCPLILAVDEVYRKIRNLKYRYIADETIFPEEVDQYDPFIIREALHNCIAHQDYTKGGKISIVEREDGLLIFSNLGKFIPKNIEDVVINDAPEVQYRNKCLTDAMVGYGMMDAVGSGIRRMFLIQQKKCFPLPEYDLSNQKVKLTIFGKVLDLDYARKLAILPNLLLYDIMLLDKVAKRKKISKEEAKHLKAKKLIEGRMPNYYVSSTIAKVTSQKSNYIKQRGFKDDHYKEMILKYIQKYGQASKKDIDALILDMLPFVLSEQQKKNKVRNIVYAMSKKDKTITNEGTKRYPKWVLSLSKNNDDKSI